jgi:tetratricopeptide (TPR) repeat protein
LNGHPNELRSGLALAAAVALAAAGCGGDRQGGVSGAEALDQGLAELTRGDYRKAARRLEAAARDQSDASAFCNLGIAYAKLGEKDKAVEALRLAADIEHTNSLPLEWLGQTQLGLKRWNEARDAFRRAQEIAGDTPRLLTSLAVVEYHTGEYRNAALLLRKALDMDARYAPALYNLGVLHRDRLKNRKEALRYFQRYLALETGDPHAVKLREELGKLGIGAGTAGGAAPRPGGLQEPRVGRPRAESAARQASQGAIGMGQGQEAAGSRARPPAAARQGPRMPAGPVPPPARQADPLVARARAAIQREALDEGLEILKDAVRREPRNADALWELATLYNRNLNDPAKAAQLYRRFKESFPDDPRCRSIPAGAAGSGAGPGRR